MDYTRKELLVYRILSGKLIGRTKIGKICIFAPTIDLLFEAQEIYNKYYNEAIFDDMFNEDELLTFLYNNNYWTQEDQTKFTELPKLIDDLKESLFNNYLKSNTVKSTKERLKREKTQYSALFNKLHRFDHMTADGLGNMAKSYFLIKQCCKINRRKIRPEEYDEVLGFRAKNRITEDEFRELSTTEPWRTYWNCGNPLGEPSAKLTDEQRSIFSFSKFYDSIYDSPECPIEDVIKDHDMLDGWVISQKKKRDKNRIQQQLDVHGKADTVFLPVETIEDAKKVNELNSPHANQVKAQRAERIKKQGEVKHQDFDDQRLQMYMAQNRGK